MGKTSLKKALSNDWVLHSPLWVAWIVLMNSGDTNGFGFYTQRSHDILFPLIINTSLNAIYSYGNALWLAPRFFKPGRSWSYFLAIVIFSSAFILIKTGAEKVYIYYYLEDLRSVRFFELLTENLITLPAFLIGSYVYWVYWKNKKEKEWLTQEKLSRELALIKAQMSPHFLFNALNNLYSLGLQGNEKMVSSGILKLSGLLRYMIYDSQVQSISLKKELDYISDFIEVNNLMFLEEDQTKVNYEVIGNPEGYQLAPMILVTFVENAFKYGVGKVDETDISIKAQIDMAFLIFSVKNRICRHGTNQSLVEHEGLGLKNVKKQLEIEYENRHSLSIQEEDGYFMVDLKIQMEQ